MEKGFKKWYNKYVGQKETAEAVSRPLDEVSPVEAFCFLRLRSVQIPMRHHSGVSGRLAVSFIPRRITFCGTEKGLLKKAPNTGASAGRHWPQKA